MSKITPKNGYIVLKPIESSEEMVGNIILPDMGKERPETGEVISTSGTYNYHSDKEIPSSLEIGDIVLIPKMGTTKISLAGEDYFITKETEVLAILS
jgi:chaperonin GroES